ncbi:MAG TPA: FkbM family methyltransferase [Azospirillaceae bacterium]|nr:FkbM family methyltransferase [Azospirillaceae bacterium]
MVQRLVRSVAAPAMRVAKAVLPRPVANFVKFQLLLHREMRAGEPELRFLPRLLDRNRAAVDVGANVGMVTYLLRGRTSRVYAVEPNPILAEKLRRDFAGAPVEVLNMAVSDVEGVGTLLIPTADGRTELTGRSSLEPGANAGLAVRPVKVAKRTLDGLGLANVGFIKVDVEGHEPAVLRGASGIIERDRPMLMVEAEEKFAPGLPGEIFDFLGRHGYRGVFLWEGRWVDVDGFRPSVHQPPHKAKRIGEPAEQGYVRNFLFIHRGDHGRMQVLHRAA